MLTVSNDEWLKSAKESLDEMIGNKEWGLAKCLIADTMDRGLMNEARDMNRVLRDAMDEQPTFAEKYILAFLRKKNEQFKKMGLIPTVDVLIDEMEGTKVVEEETPRCKKCGERTIRWFRKQALAGYHCSYCGTDTQPQEMEGKKE